MYANFDFDTIAENAFNSAEQARARNPRISRGAYWLIVQTEIGRRYNTLQAQGETLLAKEEWEITSNFSSQRMLDDIYRIGDLALQAGIDPEDNYIKELEKTARDLAEAIRTKSAVFAKMGLAVGAANEVLNNIPPVDRALTHQNNAKRAARADADELLVKAQTVLGTKDANLEALQWIYKAQEAPIDKVFKELINEYNAILTKPQTDADKKRLGELQSYLLSPNLWKEVDTSVDRIHIAITAGTAVDVNAKLPGRFMQNQAAEYFIRLVQQYNQLVALRGTARAQPRLLAQCLDKIQDIITHGSNNNNALETIIKAKTYLNRIRLDETDCQPIDGGFEQIIRANAAALERPELFVLDFNTSNAPSFRGFLPAEKVLDAMAVAMEVELTRLFVQAQNASPNTAAMKEAFKTQFEAQLKQGHEALKLRLAGLDPNTDDFQEQLYIAVADEHMSRCVQQARAAVEEDNQKTYETQRKNSLTQAKEKFNKRSPEVEKVTDTMPADTMDDDAKLLRAASTNETIQAIDVDDDSADLDLRTVNYLLFNPFSLDDKLVDEIYRTLHMAPGSIIQKQEIREALLKEIRTGGLSKFDLNYQELTGARTVSTATHRAEIDSLVKERAEKIRRLLFRGKIDRKLAANEVDVVVLPGPPDPVKQNIPSTIPPKFVLGEIKKVEEATILVSNFFDPEFIDSEDPVVQQAGWLKIKADVREDALRGKYEHFKGLEVHQKSLESKVIDSWKRVATPNLNTPLKIADPKHVHAVLQRAFNTAVNEVDRILPDFSKLQQFTVNVYKNIITEFQKNLKETIENANEELAKAKGAPERQIIRNKLKEKITKDRETLSKNLREQFWQLRQVLDDGTENFQKDPSYYDACHKMLKGIKTQLDKIDKKTTSTVDEVFATVLSTSPVAPDLTGVLDSMRITTTTFTADLEKFVKEAFVAGEKIFSQSADQQDEALRQAFAKALEDNKATISHTILNNKALNKEQKINALQEKYLELTKAAYETVKRDAAKHWDELATAREAAVAEKLKESTKELQEHFIRNLIVPLNPGLFPKTASAETPKLEPGKEYKLSESGKLTMRVDEYGAVSFNVKLSEWAKKVSGLLPVVKKGVDAIDWARNRLAYDEIAKEIGVVAAFIKTPVTVNCPGNPMMEAIITAALESKGVIVLGKRFSPFEEKPNKVAKVARGFVQAAAGTILGAPGVVAGVDTADPESKALKVLKGAAQFILGGITRDPKEIAAGMKTIVSPSEDGFTKARTESFKKLTEEQAAANPNPSPVFNRGK